MIPGCVFACGTGLTPMCASRIKLFARAAFHPIVLYVLFVQCAPNFSQHAKGWCAAYRGHRISESCWVDSESCGVWSFSDEMNQLDWCGLRSDGDGGFTLARHPNRMQYLSFQAAGPWDSPSVMLNYSWCELLKAFWKSYSLMEKPLTYFIKLNKHQS